MKAQPSPEVIAPTASRLLKVARACQIGSNGTKGQSNRSKTNRSRDAATRGIPALALGEATGCPGQGQDF